MDNKNEKNNPSEHISLKELKDSIKKEGLEDVMGIGKSLGLDNKNEQPGSGSGKSENLSSKDLQGFPKADLNQIANIAKDMIINNKLGLDNQVNFPLSAAMKSRIKPIYLSEEEIAKSILEASQTDKLADKANDMTINPKLAQSFPQTGKMEFLSELRKINKEMKVTPTENGVAVTEENIAEKLLKLRSKDGSSNNKDNKPK